MVFVTFEKIRDARTGNILFQYLAAKIISLEFGHEYKPFEEIENKEDNILRINEDSFPNLLHNSLQYNIRDKNIICRGYFQKQEYYIPKRELLLNHLYESNDYWFGFNGQKEFIQDFLKNTSHSIKDLSEKDVVIHLRLDNFIKYTCPTSDIIPPHYYLNILENLIGFERVFIVCDIIRHHWEHRYIEFFNKFNPILLQNDLMHDCALMRDAPTILHSNSSLCWIMSFLSTKKKMRYIPKTNFYSGQSLFKIEDFDILTDVSPLSHHNVENLNLHNYLMENSIFPLSYCIPDEYIVDFEQVAHQKITQNASLIPGKTDTYVYGPDDQDAYYKMYQHALFAITRKKGGWDCLRHYEILANGCIPIFLNLEYCPSHTLKSLPKDLILEASQKLLPWNFDNKPLYDSYLKKILEHMKQNCSASANVRTFFNYLPSFMKERTRNVLLIMGNCGVNYTRETFWIGMKRYIQSLNGVAVEYPKIDFLYKNCKIQNKNLYGYGYTYSRCLEEDYHFSNEDIEEKVKNRFFDMIIYGKVGPDEGHEGSIQSGMPLWKDVFHNYNKNEIVFLYGGDECIDLTYPNHYKEHILYHSQFGHCFVRELHK
jgi:hypothetical protein